MKVSEIFSRGGHYGGCDDGGHDHYSHYSYSDYGYHGYYGDHYKSYRHYDNYRHYGGGLLGIRINL